jgi:hypothetical protein
MDQRIMVVTHYVTLGLGENLCSRLAWLGLNNGRLIVQCLVFLLILLPWLVGPSPTMKILVVAFQTGHDDVGTAVYPS